MELTEYEWRREPMSGLYEVGKMNIDQVIEKIANLTQGQRARFGFGRMVILNENGNYVHKMQIRAEGGTRTEVKQAGFSPFIKVHRFKRPDKLRKWLLKYQEEWETKPLTQPEETGGQEGKGNDET